MELPPALFEDVTGQPAYAANPWPDESPLPNWVFLGQRATVLHDGEDHVPRGSALATRIGRVSILGIGLLHDRPIPVGAGFTLVLPRDTAGRPPLPVRCTCVRCEDGDRGLSRIGAVFSEVPVEEYAASRTNGREVARLRPSRAA